MPKYFTGVGSREIDHPTYLLLEEASEILAARGYILRSGKADGSDKAFQRGYENACADITIKNIQKAEIYIPWANFEKNSGVFDDFDIPLNSLNNVEEATEIIRKIHPAWDAKKRDGSDVMSQGAKKLHTRNVYQVLGKDLNTPSDLLICYAKPEGKYVKGGTRTAYKLAKDLGIPCFNLYNKAPNDLWEFLLEFRG